MVTKIQSGGKGGMQYLKDVSNSHTEANQRFKEIYPDNPEMLQCFTGVHSTYGILSLMG